MINLKVFMASNVNGNCWSSWSSDLNTSSTVINTINSALNNMNSGSVTYQEYMNDLNQIQSAINTASNLPSTPLLSQFLTGVNAAYMEVSQTMYVTNPSTGQKMPATDAGGIVSFTVQTNYTQLSQEGAGTPSWMPSLSQSVTLNGETMTLGQLLQLSNFMGGMDCSVSLTLPDGTSIEIDLNADDNGNYSMQIFGPANEFANDMSMGSADTSALTTFMAKW